MYNLFLVFLFTFTTSSAAEFIKIKNVLILTPDNFDKAIEQFPHILVEFYAPWCGHCKALAPEYAKAAGMLKDEGSDVRLGKVNADEHRKLAEKYGVQGFPTIIFYTKGKVIQFEQTGRQANDIVSWLKKKTGPPAAELENVDGAKAMIDKDDVVVVGFFKDKTSAFIEAFLEVAAEMDDVTFCITSAANVFIEYMMDKDGVVLFKKFDEGRVDYVGNKTTRDISLFIAANRHPLIMEFTEETSDHLIDGEIKNHVLLFLQKTRSDFKSLTDNFRTAARHFRGKCLFTYIDAEEDDNRNFYEFLGFTQSDPPGIRLVNFEEEKMIKYKPESSDLEPDDIKQFVQDVFDGKIQPYLRSADVPEDWDAKPVKVLVGKNFDKVVADKSKDVFVEYYAPWCPVCQELAPVWDQLGEKYKNHDSIVIAKMDATVNDAEDLQVYNFPTIILIKKNTNEIIEYSGDMALEALVEFIESGGANISEAETDDNEEEMEEEEDHEEL